MSLKHRKAVISDVKTIVSLLAQDKLSQSRELTDDNLDQRYIDAFKKINNDPNQYLMVLYETDDIIGTCHLTLMPSLTFKGSTRMQIEAVRVREDVRGKSIGEQMIKLAIDWGKKHGAKIFQLSTNKERAEAVKFYQKLGFKATHEGMKLYLE